MAHTHVLHHASSCAYALSCFHRTFTQVCSMSQDMTLRCKEINGVCLKW